MFYTIHYNSISHVNRYIQCTKINFLRVDGLTRRLGTVRVGRPAHDDDGPFLVFNEYCKPQILTTDQKLSVGEIWVYGLISTLQEMSPNPRSALLSFICRQPALANFLLRDARGQCPCAKVRKGDDLIRTVLEGPRDGLGLLHCSNDIQFTGQINLTRHSDQFGTGEIFTIIASVGNLLGRSLYP